MAKKKKVEKVSKETGVDAADLNRLPMHALKKLDALVPDEDEVDIFEGTELEESQEEDHQDVEVVAEAPVNVGGRLVGHNPITKEPIYK